MKIVSHTFWIDPNESGSGTTTVHCGSAYVGGAAPLDVLLSASRLITVSVYFVSCILIYAAFVRSTTTWKQKIIQKQKQKTL